METDWTPETEEALGNLANAVEAWWAMQGDDVTISRDGDLQTRINAVTAEIEAAG